MKSHEQCKEMGKRLKAVRQSLGITQEKMAETMDVSVRQYRRYEAGDLFPSWMQQIRMALISIILEPGNYLWICRLNWECAACLKKILMR